MSLSGSLVGLVSRLLLLFVPRRCLVCRGRLRAEEEYICTACFAQIKRADVWGGKGNAMERIFWHKLPIERAGAWMEYAPGACGSELVHALKYEGKRGLGRQLGRVVAGEFMARGFFEGIDLLVPVPLHEKKKRQRGYNQSEELALGMSDVTHLPVNTTAVIRKINTPTQTLLSPQQRQENVREAFLLVRPEDFRGKHLLLIDDVFTTGATISSLGQAITEGFAPEDGDTRLSILTLALAGTHHNAAKDFQPWNAYESSLREETHGVCKPIDF